MALEAKRWSFMRSLVQDAPDHAGVYALWEKDRLVHLGCAHGSESLRDCLVQHYEDPAARARVTHYSWEITREPQARLRQLCELLDRETELRAG